MSGTSEDRPPARPIARSLPARTCGMATPGGISAIWIWPPSSAVTTCGLPAKGMWTGSSPGARLLISSSPRWATLPLCLYDLIHRWRSGVLGIEIVGVVSNHGDMREFVEWNGIPFYYLPVTAKEKQRQERELFMAFERDRADLLVLARYMQVLSPDLSTRLSGRCINIHHSFLPAFKGAKPYHQAYARGVKIIGATAHYVTDDLDEGPIIEQAVERVDHASSPDNLVQIGRDLESTVLARAVRWHIERRVMLNGSRTVVFG